MKYMMQYVLRLWYTAIIIYALNAIGADGNNSNITQETNQFRPPIGTWVGLDTEFGVYYYKLELGTDGKGFIGRAGIRMPREVWRIERLEKDPAHGLLLFTSPDSTNGPPLKFYTVVEQHWVTPIVKLRVVPVNVLGSQAKEFKSQLVVMRRQEDINSIDESLSKGFLSIAKEAR
jgi:hypothetical protein